MIFKTPSFWYPKAGAPRSWAQIVLTPASWLYGVGRRLDVVFSKAKPAPCPVICIGNLNAGGSGKTPTALAMMDLLKQKKLARNPAFLLRGYGGALVGPLQVDLSVHNASHVGEEALLLARKADSFIARDRYHGALYAAQGGRDVIIMDDGFQNTSLTASLYGVVINGEMGFGNKALLPAGPLREAIHVGLERADFIVMIGRDTHNILEHIPTGIPVFQAGITTDPQSIPPRDKQYLAFAGLGYPDKFFNYLKNDIKLQVKDTIAFDDHHAYSNQTIEDLYNKAMKQGLKLITTEKDMLQIQRLGLAKNLDITALPITLNFDDPARVTQFLTEKLKGQEA